jgi:hypothetical protein
VCCARKRAAAGPLVEDAARPPGLEALRSGRFTSAGFTTLRMTYKGMLQQYVRMSEGELERMLNALPARGDTPMITTVRVSEEGAPRLEWATLVPRAVVQDFAVAIPSVMASALLTGSLDSPP